MVTLTNLRIGNIPLTQAQVALIEDGDDDWLSDVKWCAQWAPSTQSFIAVSRGPRPERLTIRMHRVIWEHHNEPIPDGFTVDHINRDTLDNRLSNLRLATNSQQSQNQGLRSNNTSGYRGVCWDKRIGKWWARIQVDGKRMHLGHYDDPIDAALAYDAAAIEYFGEFAVLNFPQAKVAS